jgi:hypothetical protein
LRFGNSGNERLDLDLAEYSLAPLSKPSASFISLSCSGRPVFSSSAPWEGREHLHGPEKSYTKLPFGCSQNVTDTTANSHGK